MKIKEVILETDLTDRAIRLYIESGLVSPFCNESYTGRKNFEFSKEDIETLKNIATLRKAGFSISEIKELSKNDENSKSILESFIEKTNRRIESDTEVVTLLSPLLNESKISVDDVCKKLNKVTEDKTVPEEDINLSLFEKTERIFFLVFAGAGILFTVLNIALSLWNIFWHRPFVHPVPTDTFWINLVFILTSASVSGYLIYCYKKPKRHKHPAAQRIRSVILVAVLCVVFYFGSLLSIFIFCWFPLTSSFTEDPSDYLVLDGDYVVSIFPESIPSFAYDKNNSFSKSTKYHYDCYTDADISDVDIIAQWTYPETDYYINQFRNEINYYKQIKNEYTNTLPEEIIKGDWICLNYCKVDETDWQHGYKYKIFAYNEKTLTVRYIYSSGYGPCGSAFEPDHFSLDW